jgi:hypothetical protein
MKREIRAQSRRLASIVSGGLFLCVAALVATTADGSAGGRYGVGGVCGLLGLVCLAFSRQGVVVDQHGVTLVWPLWHQKIEWADIIEFDYAPYRGRSAQSARRPLLVRSDGTMLPLPGLEPFSWFGAVPASNPSVGLLERARIEHQGGARN